MKSDRGVLGLILALTFIGAAIRIRAYGGAVIGDELSTAWIVRGNSLGEVVSRVYSDAEITPPAYFIMAWLASKLGTAPELIRLPSLLAGIATIPLSYVLGLRMIGRAGALVGAAIVTVSPLMVFYSANARSYSMAIAVVMVSTLAMLIAAHDGRRRWWAVYGLSSCLAMYLHYTVAFVLIGQLLWLLWAFPEARRMALIANLVAALFYLPWIGGALADTNSITLPILELLQDKGLGVKLDAIRKVVFFGIGPPKMSRDWLEVWLVSLGTLTAVVAALTRVATGKIRLPKSGGVGRGLVLAAVLTFSTVLGEGLLLLFGTDLLGTRNLTATWNGLPFLAGGLVAMGGFIPGIVSGALILGGLTIGAERTSDAKEVGVPYKPAVSYVNSLANGRPSAVIDAANLTPAPLGSVELYLSKSSRLFTPGIAVDEPDFIEHVFEFRDPVPAVKGAFSGPGPVYLMTFGGPELVTDRHFFQERTIGEVPIPAGWTITASRQFSGQDEITVTTFEREKGSTGSDRDKPQSPD